MHGLMQRWPLTVEKILDHAATWRAQGEIVAPSPQGGMARGGYGQLGARARRLADSLAGLGLRRGETVAVIGFNTVRQLEAWYAIIGAGGVCQPLPPNLPADRLAALLADGGARIAFVDPEIVEALSPALERLERVVVMSEDGRLPSTDLRRPIAHDALVDQGGADGPWGGAEEESPAVLVHTVGASGQAKGVVWSHRSCVLQGMIAAGPDGLELNSREAVLPLVPFWRAGAWGLVFAAPMAGAKLILPGPNTDAKSIRVLADRESATLTMGAPAELQALHDQYRAEGRRPPSLKRVIAVGAPTPASLVKAWRGDFGVEIRSAWGSAETSGLGAVFDPSEPDLRPPFGVELKTEGGRLKARGAVVADGYLREGAAAGADGFLDTGDLATSDGAGRIAFLSRGDDTVDSGGRPVPARIIEEAALAHPATAQAAVLDPPEGLEQDGPLLVVRRKPDADADKTHYLRFLHQRLGDDAPADVMFVDSLPLDAAGRIDKFALRRSLDRITAPASAFAPTGRIQPLELATAAASAAAMTPSPVIYKPLVLPPEDGGTGDPSPDAESPAASSEPVESGPTADQGATTYVEPEFEPAVDLTEPETAVDAPEAQPAVAATSEAVEELGPLTAVTPPPAETGSGPRPADPDLAGPIDALFAPPTPPEAPEPAEPPGVEASEPFPAPAADDEAASPFAATVRAPRPARRKAPAAARVFLSFTTLLALAPVVLIAVGAVGVREGLIDWRYGLGELMIDWPYKLAMVGLVGGILGLFAALMAGIGRLWRKALASLLLPVAVLAGLLSVKAGGESYPPIHDVATDWTAPIVFSPHLIQARGPEAAPVTPDPFVPMSGGAFMTRRVADVNAETCPGAHTAVLPATPGQAYDLAKAAVRAAGMELFIDDPEHGRLEAVATNPWLGFKDDLAVRVAPDPGGPRTARVDMRSVSRNDTPDFGANCARVSRLIAAIGG